MAIVVPGHRKRGLRLLESTAEGVDTFPLFGSLKAYHERAKVCSHVR